VHKVGNKIELILKFVFIAPH